MPTFNHVNLGTPVGGREAMGTWLVEIIGLRPVSVSGAMARLDVRWFEADDGMQVHLSEDPDHRPAQRAHVAVDFGDQLDTVAQRLRAAGTEYTTGSNPELAVLNCCDPAGNRWELRGQLSSPDA